MARDSRQHHFAHWFLYSSAYESWGGLEGWFQPAEPAETEGEGGPRSDQAPRGEARRRRAKRPRGERSPGRGD